MQKIFIGLSLLVSMLISAQQIENAESLKPFLDKIKQNQSVSNILFLGDSHIQAGWIPEVLRLNFQQQFGNAGRGLVFPYALANSNGPADFIAISNQAWQTFRLVYDQDIFSQMGVLGFVMGNEKNSFIEIKFNNPQDDFDRVKIFADEEMQNDQFTIYESAASLNDFVSKKKSRVSYVVQDGETFPELAAKFNTTTTRLVQLNGSSITKPKVGNTIAVEQVDVHYNPSFEDQLKILGTQHYQSISTTFDYPKSSNNFLLKTNATKGNIFYGFQFLKKNADTGVVFNAVGVNGATYSDFLKYPLQIKSLRQLNNNLVIISLGSNESVSSINKEDYQKSIANLVTALRSENHDLPILLVSPTDNIFKNQKVESIVNWTKEVVVQNNVAFINMYTATGGKGYFRSALAKKEANADGIHFMKSGYEKQGQMIWKALQNIMK